MNRVGLVLAVGLIGLVTLPLFGLLQFVGPSELWTAATHPMFVPALFTSIRTSFLSVGVILVTGTPLAWWLSRTSSRWSVAVERVTELPVLLPPSVVGIGLLAAFSPDGWLPLRLPFTGFAVVLAQIVVAAPFFVHSAVQAFRTIDDELLLAARTLGATPPHIARTIVLPLALPGLVAGASLSWARALGEFGATLLFAGNTTGTTQTLPLAIYTAMQSDVRLAVVFALFLVVLGVLVSVTAAWIRR